MCPNEYAYVGSESTLHATYRLTEVKSVGDDFKGRTMTSLQLVCHFIHSLSSAAKSQQWSCKAFCSVVIVDCSSSMTTVQLWKNTIAKLC
jgi:hypothetical protein